MATLLKDKKLIFSQLRFLFFIYLFHKLKVKYLGIRTGLVFNQVLKISKIKKT